MSIYFIINSSCVVVFTKRVVLVYITLFALCLTLAFFGDRKGQAPLPDYNTTSDIKYQTPDYFKGVWISYTEFADMIKDKDEPQYKARCGEVADSICQKGYNSVILHVRAHCDAYYYSDIFPFARGLKKPDFDPLEIFLTVAREHKLSVQGWINPFRGFEGMT